MEWVSGFSALASVNCHRERIILSEGLIAICTSLTLKDYRLEQLNKRIWMLLRLEHTGTGSMCYIYVNGGFYHQIQIKNRLVDAFDAFARNGYECLVFILVDCKRKCFYAYYGDNFYSADCIFNCADLGA